MQHRFRRAVVSLCALVAVAQPLQATERHREIRHVLLLSVDGLHALDVARFVAEHPGSALAEVFDESIDLYVGNVSQDVLDPTRLPRHLDPHGHCVPLFPHDALRTNTVFEVARAEGLHTAWADKHPAYDLVNGPSGRGVEDLYTPEITNVGGFDATDSVVCTAQNDEKKVQAILNQIHGRRRGSTTRPCSSSRRSTASRRSTP